ncbi:Uncharacterised protein [uncultured archaeon]|nr:Uncharacterised protein [uncultured archaeon]
MATTVATINERQKAARILPPFRNLVMEEGVLKADGAVRKDKEEGYTRCYYPDSDVIEEIGPTGIKVRFAFDRSAFKRLEREEPKKAAVFYRYNAEMFGSVSCDIAYLVRLYGTTPSQVKEELCGAEREVLKIKGITQQR